MEFLIENWALLLAVVAVLVTVGISVYAFFKKPTTEQIQSVKEWLLYAVVEAEKYFGGGTGQLKLRFVYDMFVEKFPYLAKVITFNLFSGFVDEALEKMKSMLDTNTAVQNYVKGE